jgi:hypothetical protein
LAQWNLRGGRGSSAEYSRKKRKKRKLAVKSTTGSLHDSRKIEEKLLPIPDSRKVAVKSTTMGAHTTQGK